MHQSPRWPQANVRCMYHLPLPMLLGAQTPLVPSALARGGHSSTASIQWPRRGSLDPTTEPRVLGWVQGQVGPALDGGRRRAATWAMG